MNKVNFDPNEPIKICVQCNIKYQESNNPEGHCLFHVAAYDSWKKTYPCCSNKNSCSKGSHKDNHHDLYSYGNFYLYAWDILNYTDTIEEWSKIKDKDLENDDTYFVSVGRLLRHKSRANSITNPPLVIRSGTVNYNKKFLFKIFTSQDLVEVGRLSNTFLFRSSDSKEAFTSVQWIIEDQRVTGLRIEAKSSTSVHPFVNVLEFDSTSVVLGKVNVVSEGGIDVKMPSKPYPDLSESAKYVGFKFDKTFPETRQFKSGGDLPLRVKVEDIQANPRSSEDRDLFGVNLSFINTHSENLFTIVEVKAEWKLKGDELWRKVDSLENPFKSAVACKPLTPQTAVFFITVNDQEKKERGITMFNRSWIARLRPIRFKFEFEDINGNKGYQIVEYQNPPPYLREYSDPTRVYAIVHNPENGSQDSLPIENGDLVNDKIFNLNGTNYTSDDLTKIVYKCIKEKNFEYLLESKECDNYSWYAWALIDESCKRIME
jgi:hypothetical protein